MTPNDAQIILKSVEASGEDLGIGYRLALETIAGMREEWGVSCGGRKPGAWWASLEEADQCAKRMSIGTHYPRPIVVVRRYVGPWEEA